MEEVELFDINKLILRNRLIEIQKRKGNVPVYIVEFGCGFATQLLLDIKKNFNINLVIDTFGLLTCYFNQPNCNIVKKQLLTCSDSTYNKMFNVGIYNPIEMVKSQQSLQKRMVNCFYEIKEGDLRDKYDMAILAGPNSNGKDIGFLHIKDRMEKDGFIMLNHLDKYISLEQMDKFFETRKAFHNNAYSINGRIGLYKIINNL